MRSLLFIVSILSVFVACSAKQITLYQFPFCPFCAKVRTALDEQGVDYDIVNVPQSRSDELRVYLYKQSGVYTVPVLRVQDDETDNWIGDSGNIIRQLGAGVF
ncbi:hypothetical protein P9112_005421 [Eukaryota sp. TZLM1-RC]